MISRLDRLQGRDIYENTALAKINELVDFCNDIGNARWFLERHEEQITKLNDAVNELQEQYDNVCIWVGEQKLKTPAKNVQDEFAEQRKWIGKLCRFRDNPACEWKYGILYRIYEDAEFPFWDTDCYEYAECEPVKPDDDIIYRGE